MPDLTAVLLMLLLPANSNGSSFPTSGSIIAHQKTYWSEPGEVGPPEVLHYVVMVDRELRANDLRGYILVEYSVCHRDMKTSPTRDYQRVVDWVEPPADKTVHTKLRMRLTRNRNCDCPSDQTDPQPDHCGNVFLFTDDAMPVATGHLPCYSMACGDFEVVAEE